METDKASTFCLVPGSKKNLFEIFKYSKKKGKKKKTLEVTQLSFTVILSMFLVLKSIRWKLKLLLYIFYKISSICKLGYLIVTLWGWQKNIFLKISCLNPWNLWIRYLMWIRECCKGNRGYVFWDAEIILDYLCKFSLITWVLKRRENFSAVFREMWLWKKVWEM